MINKILLQTAAPDFPISCNFYRTLGFKKMVEGDQYSVVADAQMQLIINGQTAARTGFVCYTDHYLEIKQKLSALAAIQDLDVGFVTADPNGVRLYIKPLADYPTLVTEPINENNMCGTNYGAGIETHYFEESVNFWSMVGYKPAEPILETTQYASLSHDDGMSITLYKPGICPHAFYNPSLTYFNGKKGNPIVIDNLKSASIKIVEEITLFNENHEVDNIIISDPGGLHSFIFNDG